MTTRVTLPTRFSTPHTGLQDPRFAAASVKSAQAAPHIASHIFQAGSKLFTQHPSTTLQGLINAGRNVFVTNPHKAFRFLENNPLAHTLAVDVLAFNAPKMLMARTRKELFDVATLEFSNTAITLGASLTLPWLMRFPAALLSGVSRQNLTGIAPSTLAPAAKYARLGAAFGFMLPFASAFWAAAFFRNYMTLKRNKTASFERIIGKPQAGQGRENPEQVEKSKRAQLHMALKTVTIGAVLGLGSLLLFGLKARSAANTKTIGKVGEWLYQHFSLDGKSANQVRSGWATFAFWLVPAYAGWIHAARGKNELREMSVKTLNSILWFSLFTPFIVKPAFLKKFIMAAPKKMNLKATPSYDAILKLSDSKLAGHFLSLKNKQEFWSLFIKISMLAVTPQLINIMMTNFFTKNTSKRRPLFAQTSSQILPPAPRPALMNAPHINSQAFASLSLPNKQLLPPVHFQAPVTGYQKPSAFGTPRQTTWHYASNTRFHQQPDYNA